MFKGCICLFCVFTLFYCKPVKQELVFTPPQFKDTLDLQGRIVNDSFIMGLGYDIDCYKDYLIVNAFKGGEEEAVHFFRISDGTHLKSILPQGRGPGEAISVRDLDVNRQTGDVLFYDVMSWRLLHFNIDSVINYENPREYIFGSQYPVYMYAVYQGKNGYITKGGNKLKNGEIPRFSIVEKDSIVYSYCAYPEVTIPGVPKEIGIRIAYKYTSRNSLSPDRTKLACTSGMGGILEIFDIRRDKILLHTVRGFYRPEFTIDKNERPIDTPQTLFALTDIYTTDKYLYIRHNSRTNDPNANEIAVFDWEGNCIRLYRMDYYVDQFCVDEVKNKLYTLCRNPDLETLLVEYDLNENS